MQEGRRLALRPPLVQARGEAAARLAALPARLRALRPAEPPYAVTVSPALAAREQEVRTRIAAAG